MYRDSERNSDIESFNLKKDRIRKNLNRFTRRAFLQLPPLKEPRILDLGCGTGLPTIELLRLCDGSITAVDIDEPALNRLRIKTEQMGLSSRIQIINATIESFDTTQESFDLIWSEGSVFVLGFEESIKRWNRYLKPGGFLVIHDENSEKKRKLDLSEKYGFTIIQEFDLTEDVWWRDYYAPLETLINSLITRTAEDSEFRKKLKKEQDEVQLARCRSIIISSFFVILQKTPS